MYRQASRRSADPGRCAAKPQTLPYGLVTWVNGDSASSAADHGTNGGRPAAQGGPTAPPLARPAPATADHPAPSAGPAIATAPGPEPTPPKPTVARPATSMGPATNVPAPASPAVATATRGAPGQVPPPGGPPALPASASDLFARYLRDYAADHLHQRLAILHAGVTTAEHDLGTAELRAEGADISVTLVDDDHPVTRAALAASPLLAGCAVGDLRMVPLPPRSQDIVQCALVLDRIEHTELVLDRLVAALKPGGLLFLRIRDRDSAAGFFDRRAPGVMRAWVWRTRHSAPGPYPAIYERINSARGIQSFALVRGLVFAERQALGGTGNGLPRGPRGFLLLQRLIAWLSRDRITAAHEELLFVVRKPENRFARLI